MTPELAFVFRVLIISLVILGLEQLFNRRAQARTEAQRSAREVIDLSAIKAPPVQLQRANINAVQTGTMQPTTTLIRLEPLPRTDDATHHVTEKRAA